MAANKLIVTGEQKGEIRRYVMKGLSSGQIAKKFKVSQPTMWRVMEEMGLNKKKNKAPQKKKQKNIFNWNDFNNSVI